MLVYGLGHKVKRNGQLNLIEAVCYPRDASPTNTGLTPPPTTNQYPSVITPTDKVHIKLGKIIKNLLNCVLQRETSVIVASVGASYIATSPTIGYCSLIVQGIKKCVLAEIYNRS